MRVAVLVTLALLSLAERSEFETSDSLNVAINWENAALGRSRDAGLGAPVMARTLAIVSTCMYDAWAAYDNRAVGHRA